MNNAFSPPSSLQSQTAAAGFKPLPTAPFFAELPKTDSAVFDTAIRTVFHHEGYYSNDPDDPGGPTIYGISLRTARQIGDLDGDSLLDLDLDGDGDVDAADLKLLTPEEAVDFYKRAFWDPHPYSRLPADIAIKTFDLAINMGPHQAHVLLQRSVRACSDNRLIEDGIIGAKTLIAAKECYQPAFLSAIRSHAAGFYRLLVNSNPRSRKFLNGWLNRAYY